MRTLLILIALTLTLGACVCPDANDPPTPPMVIVPACSAIGCSAASRLGPTCTEAGCTCPTAGQPGQVTVCIPACESAGCPTKADLACDATGCVCDARGYDLECIP